MVTALNLGVHWKAIENDVDSYSSSCYKLKHAVGDILIFCSTCHSQVCHAPLGEARLAPIL